jgi:hypothetical protein
MPELFRPRSYLQRLLRIPPCVQWVNRKSPPKCSGCGEHAHTFRDCPKRACDICGEATHRRYECRARVPFPYPPSPPSRVDWLRFEMEVLIVVSFAEYVVL